MGAGDDGAAAEAHDHAVCEGGGAESDVHLVRTIRQHGEAAVYALHDATAADPHLDPRADAVAGGAEALRAHRERVSRGGEVAQDHQTPIDAVGDVFEQREVEVAVAVEVARGGGVHVAGRADARVVGDVHEANTRAAEERGVLQRSLGEDSDADGTRAAAGRKYLDESRRGLNDVGDGSDQVSPARLTRSEAACGSRIPGRTALTTMMTSCVAQGVGEKRTALPAGERTALNP